MSETVRRKFDLPPIDQVSYVVANLDESLPRYESLFGAFQVVEVALTDVLQRGKRSDCKLKVAIHRENDFEVELIEVLEGETPHSEHLREHGEGLHHVRFAVSGLDEKLEAMAAEGFETVFYKRFEGAGNVAFAYVESPAALGRSVIELLEMG